MSQAPGGMNRIRAWLGRAKRPAAIAVFGYLCALVAVNAVASPAAGNSILHSVALDIFPRLGSGGNLATESIQQEWDYIQSNYVIRGVSAGGVSLGAEQGIITYLHDTFGDRFSAVLPPQDNSNLQDELAGKLNGGIGIALEERCGPTTLCTGNANPTVYVIEDVLIGMPADRAGLQNNDILEAVNGASVYKAGASLDSQVQSVVNNIKGQAGTPVTLTVKRGAATLNITVTRQNLQIPSVYSRLLGNVLYVEITGFDSNTSPEIKQQLQQGINQGAKGVVLDLRDNGGGLVEAAQTVASQFLTPGPNEQNVVVRRGRLDLSGNPKTAQNVVDDKIQSGGLMPKLPMAVLVNGNTASASEIVTMALRDYHRATVVGTQTFGKGSVQTDFALPDGNDLHLTIEKWYGPNGESIDGNGITPTVVVSLSSPLDMFRLETKSVDPSVDTQLEQALSTVNKLTGNG
jgi:carboxyl-terminal processing protease